MEDTINGISELFKQQFEETYGHKIQKGNLNFIVENGMAVN